MTKISPMTQVDQARGLARARQKMESKPEALSERVVYAHRLRQVGSRLRALGIDPHELRDYLAGLRYGDE